MLVEDRKANDIKNDTSDRRHQRANICLRHFNSHDAKHGRSASPAPKTGGARPIIACKII